VQVDSSKVRIESAPAVCNQRLKLKCDKPLSNVAFNFNLRRCIEAVVVQVAAPPPPDLPASIASDSWPPPYKVGRCRLPVSEPELKARLISALEAKMWMNRFQTLLSNSSFLLHHGRAPGAAERRLLPRPGPGVRAPGHVLRPS